MSKNKGLVLAAIIVLGWSVFSFADGEFIYDAQGKRDPFIPIITPDGRFQKLEPEEVKVDSALSLEGIIYDKYGISYAIVNGLVVKVGDTVDDYQVLNIEEAKVIFIKEGQITEMDLKKGDK
jgi:hypothetical protein